MISIRFTGRRVNADGSVEADYQVNGRPHGSISLPSLEAARRYSFAVDTDPDLALRLVLAYILRRDPNLSNSAVLQQIAGTVFTVDLAASTPISTAPA